jgi:hypothetical protein
MEATMRHSRGDLSRRRVNRSPFKRLYYERVGGHFFLILVSKREVRWKTNCSIFSVEISVSETCSIASLDNAPAIPWFDQFGYSADLRAKPFILRRGTSRLTRKRE